MDKDNGRVGVAETGSREPDPQAVPALTGFDPARFGKQYYSQDCTRILVDGKVHSLIERLSNGRWAIYHEGQRESGTYGSALKAYRSWLTVEAPAIPVKGEG